MNRVVWKFELRPNEAPQMPQHAQLLHLGVQDGRLMLWALCDPDAALVERELVVVGTGHEMPDGYNQYVGSAVGVDGDLVIHVFDEQVPF